MSDALNANISIDRFASLHLPFPISFFQHFCLFHNTEVQTQELCFLDIKSFIFKSRMPHSLLPSNLARINGFQRKKNKYSMHQAHAHNSTSRVTGNFMNAGISSQGWLNEMLSVILLLFTIRSKVLPYLKKCQ